MKIFNKTGSKMNALKDKAKIQENGKQGCSF